MIRNLKALGLAFVAVLAMSAVVSSAAQATPEYTCSTYPCTATGSNTAGNETFTTPGGTVQCDSHFVVEKYRGTNEDIAAATSTVTVTPTYTNCVAFGFLNATVNMNGCDYEFHATEKLGEGHYIHHVAIHCTPTGNKIKITAATCEVEVPAQTLTDVTTKNEPGGVVKVVPTVTEITMNVVKDGFGCPFSGTGHTKGSYHGEVTISRVGGGSISVSGA